MKVMRVKMPFGAKMAENRLKMDVLDANLL